MRLFGGSKSGQNSSITDTIIGVDHTLKDCARGDYICTTLDIVGTLSTVTGMVLGNIPSTKGLTTYTGSITFACRTVRIYCQPSGVVPQWSEKNL